MSRSKSSKHWLKEHFNDPFVKRAQQEGYRSRAVYKLLEIQKKDKLIKPGMVVIELGAAPGSWTQIIAQLVGDKGRVIALDILPMESIAGVDIIQGDFTELAVLDKIIEQLGKYKADLVISDMAPNLSGNKSIDTPKMMYLLELAFDLTKQTLKPGGSFLTKGFHGSGFDEWLRQVKQSFRQVMIRKPSASRARSKEFYLVAKDYNL